MEKLWDFFTLIPSDLITTLTYVIMDNLCPCFIFNFTFYQSKNREKIKVFKNSFPLPNQWDYLFERILNNFFCWITKIMLGKIFFL